MKQQKYRTVYQQKRKEAKEKISQEKVAEALGISSHTVQLIEAGKRAPALKVAFGMADLYGCSIEDFRPKVKGEDREDDLVKTT